MSCYRQGVRQVTCVQRLDFKEVHEKVQYEYWHQEISSIKLIVYKFVIECPKFW